MKIETGKILFGLAIFLLFGASAAQAGTFTVAAAGDWATAATWSLNSGTDADGIPDADDSVAISGNFVTVTGAESVHILTLSGIGLTLNAGSTLTMDGTAGSSFSNLGTVNGTGTIRTQGTTAIAPNTGFTAPLEIMSGTTTFSTFSIVGGSINILSGAILQLPPGGFSVTHAGDLTVGGTLNIGAGSNYTANGANIVNNGSITGATLLFNGTAQNLSGTGSITNTLTFVANGSTVTLTSNVTIASTNFTVSAGGSLAIGGNTLTLNGVNLSNGGTVTSTGAGLIRTQGATSLSIVAGFSGSLEINSGTTTFSSSTISGSINILSGAILQLPPGGFVVTHTGDLTVGGTLNTGAGSVFFANGANIVNNGSITGATLRFNGTAQNLSGTGSMTNTLTTINNLSTVTLTSNVTIASTDFTVIAGGGLAIGGNTLILNGVNFTNSGTVTSTGAGLIRTQGATSLSIVAGFSGSLEINSGTTTFSSSTISGSINILSGAILQLPPGGFVVTHTGDLTVGGTLNTGAGSTFNANSANIVNNGSITGDDLRFNGTVQNLSGTGSITGATTTIFSGSTVTLGSNHQLATLAVNMGGTLNTSTFTLFLNGAGTPLSGAGTIANVNITYNGAAAQTVQSTNVTYNQLGINNAAGVTLTAAETVTQRLTLTNGAFNNGAFLTLATGATIARDNGTLQTAPTLAGTINVEYFGATDVTTDIEFPTSTTVVTNLIINKTSATNTVTLNANRTVNGALTLSNGQLLTGANTLFVGASGTSTGSASSFVIGTLQKIFAAPAPFTFHVGTATGYSPATINVDAGAGSFTVNAENGVIPGSTLDPAKTLQRYWNLSSTGITQADITFQYPQADVPMTAVELQFRFVRNNGGASNTFFAPTSLNSTTNTFTLNDVTQFSPWTLHDAGPTAANANLGGRITRSDGSAIAGVQVRLVNSDSSTVVKTTDASGNYLFPSIPTGETYVITATRRGFTFSPASRVINHLDETTNSDFVATRDLSTQESTSGSDFDGDGHADLAIFRPENGTWYIKRSSDNSIFAQRFGLNGDIPTAGDYDGDGVSDFAVYRPANNVWYLLRSSDNTFSAQTFGIGGDVPATGDYDGDGRKDIAVYRPSDGVWYIQKSSNGEMRYERFGSATDKVVPADYDGDGKSDVAVYRASEGVWYIKQSSNGQMRYERFGIESDEPVSADFDGDGRTDIAVYRHSEGIWHILDSANGNYRTIRWGANGDALVPADYDGDGKADAAVFRNGDWYMLLSGNDEQRIERFGQANDKPIPKAF